MKILVNNRKHVEVLKERDADEQYSGEETETQHNITGVTEAKNYSDIQTDYPLKKGEIYYLVCCYYDTGGSFSLEGNVVQYIDIFKSENKAAELVKEIKANYDEYLKDKDTDRETFEGVIYKTEAGNEARISCTAWKGYFEQLRGAEVVKVKMK